jgi:hypothetical protein
MAKRDTIAQFLANMKNWPDAIQRKAIGIFNEETLLAKSKSIEVAPEDTGELKNKIQTIKANLTPTGIRSGYQFFAHAKDGYYYPKNVNEGIGRNGKPIKINTEKGFNAQAQTHFAEAGIIEVQDRLMDRMVKLVEEVFIAS